MGFELSLAARAERGDCVVLREGGGAELEGGDGDEEETLAESRLCRMASGEGSTEGFLLVELLL